MQHRHRLAILAEARRANALRVAGEYADAERVFVAVRRRLGSAPLNDPLIYAEMASLEASLHRDRARFSEAGALLDEAVLAYHEGGANEELARVLIKRADLAQRVERHEDALADLARARRLLDPEKQTFLYLFTVTGAVPTLLDLGRPAEAEQVLVEAEDAFAAAIEPWWALRFRYFQGRAAFGQGQHDRALRLLGEARQGFLDQHLPHEAAVVSLDLALVHLDMGNAAEAKRLTRWIVPIFRTAGIEREALAALRLFQEATVDEARRHVAILRGHLAAAQRERSRRPGDNNGSRRYLGSVRESAGRCGLTDRVLAKLLVALDLSLRDFLAAAAWHTLEPGQRTDAVVKRLLTPRAVGATQPDEPDPR